jgi:hypothetical protein
MELVAMVLLHLLQVPQLLAVAVARQETQAQVLEMVVVVHQALTEP